MTPPLRTDIDAAIDAANAAALATPAGHPELSGRLSNLSNALTSRFERFGEPADIDAAIDATKAAVASTPPGHPDLSGRLSNLSNALTLRFGRFGDRVDIDAAIDAATAAVLTIPDVSVDRSIALSNQSRAFRQRFERFGEPADIDASIDAATAAVANTPADNPALPGRLSTLSIALRERFDQFGQRPDIDAAIDALSAAVATTPADNQALPGRLSNLSNALRNRFEQFGDPADLDAAIDTAVAAIADLDDGHHEFWALLTSLSNALRCRFGRFDERPDIDAAVVAATSAVALAPDDHPGLPGRLSNQVWCLLARARSAEEADTADMALALAQVRSWCRAVGRVGGEFRTVFSTTRSWCDRFGSWAVAGWCGWDVVVSVGRAGLGYATRVFDQLTPSSRLVMRRDLDGVGASCAYAMLMLGDLAGAVEMLESTGATIARLEASTIDWEAAYSMAPELARSAFVLSDQINNIDPDIGTNLDGLTEQYASVVADLRVALGLPDPQPASLTRLSESPDVFMWIITTQHGGAVIRQHAGQVDYLLLPALTTHTAANWQQRLHPPATDADEGRGPVVGRSIRGPGGIPDPVVIESVLDELDAALAPAADWLSPDADDDGVVWCLPVGVLRLLPWHARAPRRRLHLTATHTLQHANRPPDSAGRVVVFANPTGDLEGAQQEGDTLEQYGAEAYTRHKATIAALAAVEGPIGTLHIAAHGTAEPALLFHNPDQPEQREPLNLGNIGKIRHLWPRTQHLILNCCVSAQHLPGLTEEHQSIATIALTNGTHTTTVALWPLHDQHATTWALHHHHPNTNHTPTTHAYLTWG